MMETYHGYVRTPADAIKLFEACRLGLLPRVQRRLSEKERQSIQSGSVFVWDEREAGMRRWTDGKSWSASRVSGSFLTYREMEGKRGGGFGNARRGAGKTPDSSGRGSDEDQDDGEPDGYRYKADGLMKQSFSITTSTGQHLHLISYYSRPLPGQQELLQPSSDSALRGIVPVKGMYPESSMNEAPVPAMTRAPMQQPPYPSPHQQPPPPAAQQYPQYAQQQPGYSWPPSPIATPPYSHYTHTPGYPQQNHQNHLPPPPAGHYAPQPNYSPAPHYERVTLPPPIASTQAQARASPPHLAPYNGPGQVTTSPHMSQSQLSRSPRLQHLQTHSPQGAAIDPKLAAMSARNPQGPLPAISAAGPTSTPPQRALSASPPRSSHSDLPTGNKASLSALLHPTPASSEPNSANPGTNSAGSSPRQMMVPSTNGALSHHPPPRGEDARALSVLDRKFRI